MSRWTHQSMGPVNRWSPPRHLGHRVERRRSLTWQRGIIVAAVIGFIYLIVFSHFLDINEVTVQGNSAISTDTITTAVNNVEAGRRWLIFPQRNILFLSDADLKQTIHDIRLQDLQVSRRPWGRLLITINEKAPVAFWQAQGNWYAVDQTGVIIAPAAMEAVQSPTAIHVLNSGETSAHAIGDTVISPALLKAIERIHAGLTPSLGFSIANYDVVKSGEGTVSAQTNEGWLIYFNVNQDIDTQLRKLVTFVSDKNKQNPAWRKTLKYLDVRFGNTRIYYQ